MENTKNFETNGIKNHGHFPNAVCFSHRQRGLAQEALIADQEEEAFYHLIESHAPYQRLMVSTLEKEGSKKLRSLGFSCASSNIKDGIKSLKEKISELPKEWTIVHLTPYSNIEQCYNLNENVYYTNSLFLSVFTCGHEGDEPIVTRINAPKDKSGNPINLSERYHEIITEYMGLYKSTWNANSNPKRKFKSYVECRVYLDSQMKLSINQLSTDWLREWKCFLTTSFENETDNDLFYKKFNEFIEQHDLQNLPSRNKIILKYIFRSAAYLTSIELRRALNACITLKLNSSFYKELLDCSNNLNHNMNMARNPLILILDETLEVFPWEMIPILRNAPVTRMPSMHFAHALYTHHKARFVDGYLADINYDNGTYLINPGQDLPAMERRMSTFMSYWMPKWEGIVGRKPAEDEFQAFLQKGDIFVYNGHGDGCQFLSGDSIKYLHIKAVVFLFGCGSVSYRSTGPICAMYTTLQHYLSACCPCLLGMLYAVGDKDTDLMSTSILSTWIPSDAPKKWNEIDKRAWTNGQTQDIESLPSSNTSQSNICDGRKLNLLLAIAKVRKNDSHSYLTRAAFVARGLPVK